MSQDSANAVGTEPQSPPERSLYVDAIRAYATFLVVLLHVSVAYIYQKPGDITPVNWWLSNGFHAFSRSAVPLFILLSGALLLKPRRPEGIGLFLRKRTLRILPSLAIWSGIYLIYEKLNGRMTLGPGEAIASLFTQPAYGHLWFLYMILGLYLVTPILRIYISAASPQNLTYALGLWFIFGEIFPFIQEGTGYNFYLKNFVTLNSFVGLFVGGYWLDQLPITRKNRNQYLMLSILGWLLIAGLTYWVRVLHGGEVQGFVYEVASPVALMMTVGNFLLLKSLPYEKLIARWGGLKPLILGLSSSSFTIYLAHMIAVNSLQNGTLSPLHFMPATANPIWTIPLQTAIVLAACHVFTLSLRKLPLGRWLAP
jgi:surface polysaccharide O-acyltransferase-like enzyme